MSARAALIADDKREGGAAGGFGVGAAEKNEEGEDDANRYASDCE